MPRPRPLAGFRYGSRSASRSQNAILAACSGLALCALLRVSHLLYPLLGLLCGMLGGYQFIVASKLWRTASTGALYAIDLFGAWLIPAFGFWRSAALIALVSLAPLASAGFSRMRR